MNAYIQYRSTRVKRLRFNIHPHAGFNDVLREVNCIHLPVNSSMNNNVIYAILELLNNSLRACREKKAIQPVRISISIDNRHIAISITDWGGGFDISALPFDINADPLEIDLQGEAFQKYRQKHNYKRFGMGLYVAISTFDSIAITFFDKSLHPVDWPSGMVAGTQIVLGIDKKRLKEHLHA